MPLDSDRQLDEALNAVYEQWRTPGPPSGEVRVLLRTTPENPIGLPYLHLLGVEPGAVDDVWTVWDAAQLASDASPIGRVLRPLVALVPAGARWTVGRSLGSRCLLEPIDHEAPAAALRAAEARLRLTVAMQLDDPFGDFAAAGFVHDETASGTAPRGRAVTGDATGRADSDSVSR